MELTSTEVQQLWRYWRCLCGCNHMIIGVCGDFQPINLGPHVGRGIYIYVMYQRKELESSVCVITYYRSQRFRWWIFSWNLLTRLNKCSQFKLWAACPAKCVTPACVPSPTTSTSSHAELKAGMFAVTEKHADRSRQLPRFRCTLEPLGNLSNTSTRKQAETVSMSWCEGMAGDHRSR